MIIPQNKTIGMAPALLGARAYNCRWIWMSNQGGGGHWQWVCIGESGGGGNMPRNSKSVQLLGEDLWSQSQLETASYNQLVQYKAWLLSRIEYMQGEIATGSYGPQAILGFQAAILQFQAEVAAVQAAIDGQIAAGQIPQQQQQNIDAYNSGQSFIKGSFGDTISQPILGVPLWGWAAGIAALYMITK